MRDAITAVLKQTAILAGVNADAVLEEQAEDSALLPPRRLEIAFLPVEYTPSARLTGKYPAAGREQTHRTIRRVRYDCRYPVRAVFVANDAAWLAAVTDAFTAALPRKIVDAKNNLVRVRLAKAETHGFARKPVEVLRKLRRVYHIHFLGTLTADRDVPLVRDVFITPTYE